MRDFTSRGTEAGYRTVHADRQTRARGGRRHNVAGPARGPATWLTSATDRRASAPVAIGVARQGAFDAMPAVTNGFLGIRPRERRRAARPIPAAGEIRLRLVPGAGSRRARLPAVAIGVAVFVVRRRWRRRDASGSSRASRRLPRRDRRRHRWLQPARLPAAAPIVPPTAAPTGPAMTAPATMPAVATAAAPALAAIG